MNSIPGSTILMATVGSTAYGLAREGSDVDSLGIFVYDTDAFWHLGEKAMTVGSTAGEKPDYTVHEVGKYLSLALNCNPTLLELLWIPQELVRINSGWAERLRQMRGAFLYEKGIRNAYGGYAKQQIERLQRRTADGKEGFSSDTQKRTAKHARHCFRLLRQGRQLLETGELTVKVDNPGDYWAFDNASVEEIVERFAVEDGAFQAAPSVLPDRPDRDAVDAYLYDIRRAYVPDL